MSISKSSIGCCNGGDSWLAAMAIAFLGLSDCRSKSGRRTGEGASALDLIFG